MEKMKLNWISFLFWKYAIVKLRIRNKILCKKPTETHQFTIIVNKTDRAELKNVLNHEGYQYFPVLSEKDVYLINMDEYQRINKEEK